MEDHDRLDLSPLDPLGESGRWAEFVLETVGRVDEVLAHRATDPLQHIAAWRRPLLIAAAAAVTVLIPFEWALEARERQLEQVERLVALSAGWSPGDPPPTGSDFLRALRSEAP